MDQRDSPLDSSRVNFLLQQPVLSRRKIFLARFLIGLIVLVCAEVFSGAIFKAGLWNPMTWLFVYWLYFAHFFLFTTLAIKTGRTSLSSLYLWGVLFGLYESWITKVIWAGYPGEGKPVMGTIGPYGFAEISMVVIYHPVMSFLLPLAVTCVLCPSLRAHFPGLAWFTGKQKRSRLLQIYIVGTFVLVMALNSLSTVILSLNLVLAVVLLTLLLRLTKRTLADCEGLPIVTFGKRGMVGLSLYLAVLYSVMYFVFRPEGLPSVAVQCLTFVWYAWVILGLKLHRAQKPLPLGAMPVESREWPLIRRLFTILLVMAVVGSVFSQTNLIRIPAALNFVVWTIGGIILTGWAWVRGMRWSAG